MLHVPFIKHDDRNEATNSRTMHRPLIILSYTRRGKDQSTSRKKTVTQRRRVCLRTLLRKQKKSSKH